MYDVLKQFPICNMQTSILSKIPEHFSMETQTFLRGFLALHRAAYDTSAPNAKRKYPDEGEADEEEIEEYKVRKRGKSYFSLVLCP